MFINNSHDSCMMPISSPSCRSVHTKLEESHKRHRVRSYYEEDASDSRIYLRLHIGQKDIFKSSYCL